MSNDAARSTSTWDDHWSSGDPGLADAFCELTPADANEMLLADGLTPLTTPRQLSSEENRVFAVDLTGVGTVVLKVFRHARSSTETLIEQATVLASLDEAGVPVAAGVPLPSGSWIGEWEHLQFALYRWCDRRELAPKTDRDVDFRELGAVVARMHQATESIDLRFQNDYTPTTWGRASLDYLLAHDVIHPTQREAYVAVAEDLLEVAAAIWPSDPLVPIHSDLGDWNVLWSPSGAPVLIDFEDLGRGLPWQDLYLLPYSFSNLDRCDEETAGRIAGRMKAGYQSVRPLPTGDAGLSGVMEAMRGMHIECWIASRRQDRFFGVHRLTFHTKRFWASRVERIERLRGWVG